MRNASFLEKMLEGVNVEWKPLGDYAEIYDGTHLTPKYTSSGVPFVSVQNIKDLYSTKKYISLEDFEKYKYKPRKDDLFMTRIGDIGTCAIVENDNPLAYYVTLTLIRVNQEIILPKFLKHVIESSIGKAELYKRTLIRAVPIKINLGEIGKIQIPIPPLAIQAEIVRILDTFTPLAAKLTDKLNAELNARKKQYNYYRDQLLTFKKGNVEWKTLEDIVSFRRGSFPQPYGQSNWYDGVGSMPFVQVADVSDFGFSLNKSTKKRISKLAQPKSVFVKAGTVIVSLNGTLGRVAITQYDCYVDRTLAVFTDYKEDIDKKYFAYQLKNKFDIEKEFARGIILKTITVEEFSKFQIPIPPLEEQERIVAILDKFDALANSITEGLPREIELRQQQYEYYREQLLSFPKVA